MTQTQKNKNLFEILVPTQRNDGRPIHLRFHRIWDRKVREIAGGLTILTPVKGQWIYENTLFQERMIPVRIATTKQAMEEIARFTLKYYEQFAVLYYRVADDVTIITRNELA